MPDRVFVAGASGAIGIRVVPLLVGAGYEVYGTTRSPHKLAALEAAGARPMLVDAFDAAAVSRALLAARPRIVMQQLTPPLVGTVLRYGELYGPDTGADSPSAIAPLHVDAAASAALLAVRYAKGGVFNFAESDTYVSTERARRDLKWDPAARLVGSA